LLFLKIFRIFAADIFDWDVSHKTYTLHYRPAEFLRKAMPDFFELMEAMAEYDAEIKEDLGEFLSVDTSVKKNRNTFILGGSFVISF
jgi:hypothetical protein